MGQVTSLSLPWTDLAVKFQVPRFTCSAETLGSCSCVGSGCYHSIAPLESPCPSSPLLGVFSPLSQEFGSRLLHSLLGSDSRAPGALAQCPPAEREALVSGAVRAGTGLSPVTVLSSAQRAGCPFLVSPVGQWPYVFQALNLVLSFLLTIVPLTTGRIERNSSAEPCSSLSP